MDLISEDLIMILFGQSGKLSCTDPYQDSWFDGKEHLMGAISDESLVYGCLHLVHGIVPVNDVNSSCIYSNSVQRLMA